MLHNDARQHVQRELRPRELEHSQALPRRAPALDALDDADDDEHAPPNPEKCLVPSVVLPAGLDVPITTVMEFLVAIPTRKAPGPCHLTLCTVSVKGTVCSGS